MTACRTRSRSSPGRPAGSDGPPCLRFAAEGAAVVVNDIDDAGAAATAREIVEGGGRSVALAGDVADAARVEEIVAAAVTTYGRLDVMHNNGRLRRAQRGGDDDRRGAAAHARRQPLRRAPRHPGRPLGDARAGLGVDHQHRVGRGLGCVAGTRVLRRGQGGGGQPHPEHGGRERPLRHPGQRHLPRTDPDPGARSASSPTRPSTPTSSPPGASVAPRTSPRWRSSSPPTTRSTSRGSQCRVDGAMQARLNGPYLTPDAVGRE